MYFEDFEEEGNGLMAHTGIHSDELLFNQNYHSVLTGNHNFLITDRLKNEGVLVQLWLGYEKEIGFDYLPVFRVNNKNTPMELKGRAGKWGLYETRISPDDLPDVGIALVAYVGVYTNNNETVFLDDVKLAPYYSESTCYVYDLETYRLVAQMDEQHFARHYIYDQRGQLKALKLETENGIKTVRQSHFNIPSIDKIPQN